MPAHQLEPPHSCACLIKAHNVFNALAPGSFDDILQRKYFMFSTAGKFEAFCAIICDFKASQYAALRFEN